MYQRLRAWLLPGLENSHVIYARRLPQFVPAGGAWLDLGCGHSLVADWIVDPPRQLEHRAVGLDSDFTALAAHRGLRHRVAGDVHRLPFRDATFDVITANMVVEHLQEPAALFREVNRVLRPHGRMLIHTPNLTGYTTRLARLVPERFKALLARVIQRRRTEDVYPAHYRANSEATLAAAASAAGLALQRCEHVLTSPQLYNVPVAVFFELLWLRQLAKPGRERRRPVLIATLVKSS